MLNTRRKIIKQGHNTLTMTLPSKWVKDFNIKAGDEVDLIERDNGLFLSTEKKQENLRATVDISDLDIRTIWKYFQSPYREGYDEIKVCFNLDAEYDSPYKYFTSHDLDGRHVKKNKFTPFETIQQITNRFVGLEVIEHHKDYCIVKDMGEISSKEFNSSLRRVFLLIQQMAEEVVEAMKTGNITLLKHAHDIDTNIDKFHDFCVRVLNKTGFKDVRKSHVIFTILYLLELIGDEFKHIAFDMVQDIDKKKFDNLLEIGEMILEQINSYTDLYYGYEKQKVIDMSEKSTEIYFYLPKLYKKEAKSTKAGDDVFKVFDHFRRVNMYLLCLVELRIEMEY